MNQVTMLGRLVKEAELKTTNNGRQVANFSLAVDRPFTNAQGQREADFFNVVLWGKRAETLSKHVKKGQRILVYGRMQNRSYEVKDNSGNNVTRYVTELIADNFEFIERKGDNELPVPQGPHQAIPGAVPSPSFDEEIPF